MKKPMLIISAAALLANLAFALEIDTNLAKIDITAFKTANKTAVPSTFNDVKFSFPKSSGSISEILTGATASIDLNSIDTFKNPIRDKNIKEKFFSHLASQNVESKITSVSGDDNVGEVKMSVKFNNVEKEIPMKYEVKDSKLIASGEIDFNSDFNAKDAFEKFSTDKIIAGLHSKKTWPNIIVGFEVPVK